MDGKVLSESLRFTYVGLVKGICMYFFVIYGLPTTFCTGSRDSYLAS